MSGKQTIAKALTRERFKAIVQLSLPIILGMGSQNLLNLVDTAMVGQLGTVPLAAVGIAGVSLWVLTSVLQGMAAAVQAITARRLGEKRQDQQHEAIVNALYFVVFVCVPYTLLLIWLAPHAFDFLTPDPAVQASGTAYLSIRLYTVVAIAMNYCFRGYFNGIKQSVLYMQTLLLMHPINIFLNYGLIFGAWGFPEMGVEGAALGTAIATVLGTANYIRLMIKHRNPGFQMGLSVVSKRVMNGLRHLAVPACLQSFTMAVGFLLFFRIAAMIGTDALAATNVLHKLYLTCILISMGMGLGTITLVSNALGEKRPEEAVAWVKGTLFIACMALGVLGGSFALFPHFWLGLFMDDPVVIQMAFGSMVLLGLSQVHDAASMILSYAHLGGGANQTVMVVSFINQWLIFLPACFIWVYFFDGGLLEIWICLSSYRFLLFVSFLISLWRGRWLKVSL